VRADPKPKPVVVSVTAGDRPIVASHANRPCTRIGLETLELKTWVRRICSEFSIGVAGGVRISDGNP